MHPSSSQFPLSHVTPIPKEKVDTSKMEPVSKSHDEDTEYDSENPVDRESVNLASRHMGTQHQTHAWAQRIQGPSGEGHDDTYRAQTMIHPLKKKVGPNKVTGIGEGSTIEEARNKSFNEASNARIESTKHVSKNMAAVDRLSAIHKKQGYNKAKVIKIDSGKAK